LFFCGQKTTRLNVKNNHHAAQKAGLKKYQAKGKIELCTWESYEIYLTRHIIPFFKMLDLKLSEVSPRHISSYYECKFSGGRLDKKQGGLSAASMKKHSSILKMIFKEAMLLELIDRNPAALVPLPRRDPVEPKGLFLTTEEANKVLQLFRGHQLQPVLYLTLYYGLRRSEVLGLKWNAIDFSANTLRIQHTVVRQKTLVVKDKTKSLNSRRAYQLLPEIKEILLELHGNSQEHSEIFGRAYQKSDYIFVWPDGRRLSPDYLTQGFQHILRKNNFPHMRFHDLRHSAASNKGWGLKEIQEWLGHSDIQVTGNIYTHISKQRSANMAKDLENTFRL